MTKDNNRTVREWFTGPLVVALATFVAILGALFFRPELVNDPRLIWVVGFAILAALVGGLSAPRLRWGLSVFLIAMGMGLVAGLHSPAFANNVARISQLR